MPLIMDDDQYMDLFNEAEQLPIAVQTPPVKRLAQRLDELGESGCCQKISWSKSGCVASITRDGRGVNLRAFQRNPVDGKWILGDEAPLHIPSVHEEFPLVHVSWGPLGVDLAVVDAAGRILVYTAAQAADRMKLSREPFSDHESESNALVGLHWLPVAPQQVKTHSQQPPFSIISRWELHSSSYALHSGFEQLTAKKKAPGSAGQRPDGTITLKRMELNHGSLNSGESDSKINAAITALVLQHSSAQLQYMPGDDLFAIMPSDMDHNLRRLFLRGTHHCMNVVADYPPEDTAQKPFETIFRNNVLRGSLSTQNLLGMATNGSRDLSSKLAWITLNLRFTSFLLSIPTNHARGGGPESFTMETAKSVSGLLRWTMDLMVYMINDLIELSQECRKHEADRGFVQKKRRFPVAFMAHALADSETRFVVQERCSPGLFLLLCSFPRSIFRLTRQPLQLLLTISQWHMKNAPTVIHRSVFNGLMAAMIGSPVHPPHMAALVLEVDNQVRLCYTKAQYTDERRRMAEREMLISAEIPDVLMPVVTRLLTHGIDKLLDTVDPAKVMYWDLRWLGLSEDKREKDYLEKNTVDVMRKVVVSRKEGGRRRCVRCGSEMEDTEWMGGQNKCACGSPWAMGSMTKKT
ncbi:Mediator of RNA polymerase II transcription subunit 16 [Diplodia intermedia]|uniref:Mediator of RNA polymerase II transcription subunit 16 n=1 Tax=Diplodia intermedia TaxID=856260 RepID=A0ABR3TV32_9PEZI